MLEHTLRNQGLSIAPAEQVWRRQSVWSQTANQRKATLGRARTISLGLTITAAVLATLGQQLAALSAAAGRVLALVAALAIGLVPLLRRRLGKQAVADWTRARSVAEAMKSEVYTYLAEVSPYRGPDRGQVLLNRTDPVIEDAGDLLAHTTGIEPVTRSLPAVHDVASYIMQRVSLQIDDYYRPRAQMLQQRLGRLRAAEAALSVLGVVLAATAATLEVQSAAAWVAVITTVTAALTAHAAASRYEYQLVEYLRTAAELERLRDLHTGVAQDGPADDAFVARCEQIISIQNEGWMAKWTSAEQD